MTEWFCSFTKEAREDISDLDSDIRSRVLDKIKWLLSNFDKINHLPLGYGWRGFFKLRVSDWRVIYEIYYPSNEVTVHRVERRDKVYKR